MGPVNRNNLFCECEFERFLDKFARINNSQGRKIRHNRLWQVVSNFTLISEEVYEQGRTC